MNNIYAGDNGAALSVFTLRPSAYRQADVEFSTISGRIYSNHDLSHGMKKSGIPIVIRDRLNNGGSRIRLETISGDIFFRKGI